MKIKANKIPSAFFIEFFMAFCYKSKPYDFCESPSRHLATLKIHEYLDNLNHHEFVEAIDGEDFIGGAIFSVDGEEAVVEFVFGVSEHPNYKLVEGWNKILDFMFDQWKIKVISSTIERKYKRRGLMRWIKKYDSRCILKGNHAQWTNERNN